MFTQQKVKNRTTAYTNGEDLDTNEKSPERRLMAAVLARSIGDLASKNRMEREDAKAFFKCKEDSSKEGLTFLGCCEALDLDSQALLNALSNKNLFDGSIDWGHFNRKLEGFDGLKN